MTLFGLYGGRLGKGLRLLGFWSILFGLLMATAGLRAASSTFSFTLDEPSKTSAGVFAPDGTLVRTLWSKVRYPAGSNSAFWDGLDDTSNAAPAGVYQIKVLQNNTEYVWDGAIGNTSEDLSGPGVHTGFSTMQDMAISGTNAFYVSGYNEGKYDFRLFSTTDAQKVRNNFAPGYNPANVYDRNWSWVAADGTHVYFACSVATNPTNGVDNVYPGFITAFNVSDQSHAPFSAGVPIVNGSATNEIYPNGVYVGTQPGISGLAVQQSGNWLAVAVAPDNRVYLLDKTSGAAVGSFAINSPQRLDFSPDGSLWIISGASVVRCTNAGVNFSVALTLPSFSSPLDVAVDPNNANLILVADGGVSQQVKAFNASGAAVWTYGLAGGYQSNGVAVATNKFWFNNGGGEATFLCFAPDSSFWVGDAGNHRNLHFSAARNYLEQIMYQPHAYIACVDQNNPSRVFNQFLEFSVDYTKPLQQGWTLLNNWKANVDPIHISWNNGAFDDEGIFEVTTFTNGRTYALVDNHTYAYTLKELCELSTNYLRFTGIFPMAGSGGRWISLGPDGSARATTIAAAQWYESTLNGFDASGNPLWNPETLIASASTSSTDPVPRGLSFGNIRATISTNNILISFDQSLNNGWHLGGIRVGGNSWLWKAAPAVGLMNGTGNYEISNGVTYAGNTLQAIDRNVIFGYHGEFFRGQGQACQHMHFLDDGLFVGQFGEANPGHSAYEGALPGSASNGHSPSLTRTTNGDYYLWVNDESDHGPQRWHFVNARNIRELSGSGTLGSPITLTNSPRVFPTGVSGKNGNQSGELSWLTVPGATLYNIRYSLLNGGPYSTLAGSTSNLDYVAGGLTNGLTYYFAVTAILGGAEGIPSEQVAIHPFDTTQTVLAAGSMTEGGTYTPLVDISSSAPAAGQPSYIGAEHYTGVLNLRELDEYGYGNLQYETVGAKGYYLSNFRGSGTAAINFLPNYSVTPNYSGFVEMANLMRQYNVDGTLGTNRGLAANPLGTVAIGVSDTNFHYLTVVSPAQFNNPRKFNLSLTSANNTSASFAVNENIGLSHVFQFLFKGNATLTADATGGAGAIVQGLFLDDAPVTFSHQNLTLAPPTGLHVEVGATAPSTNIGAPNGFVSSYSGNGLVQWNKFNDGTGTVTADASGNGNTLSLIGSPSWGSGYLSLNGSTQYGDAGSNQLASLDQKDLTICAWINKTGSSLKGIVDKSIDLPGNQGGWGFWVTANNQLDWKLPGSLDLTDTSAATVALGQWTHVAVSWHYALRQVEFYINGILTSAVQNGADFEGPSKTAHLEVGNLQNNASGGAYAFDGAMHDVGIYNRALSAAEIRSNYLGSAFNSTVATPDFLYYKMTEFVQSNPPVFLADSSTHGGTTGTANSSYVLAWVTNQAAIDNTALHFNGVSTMIDTGNPSLFNFTTNLFTINFWVRPLTANGYLMQNGDFQVNGWYVSVGGIYQIKFGTEGNGTDNAIITAGPVAPVGAWSMVTIVRSGLGSASIFINGIQAATIGGITSPAPSANNLVIGVDRAAAHWFDGDIWQPQIWGEPLSPADIANLYIQQSSGHPWP